MLHRRSTPRTRKRIIRSLTAVVLTLILAAFTATTTVSCTDKERVLTGNAFGSYYSIEYTGENSDAELKEIVNTLNDNFDTTGSGDIAAINSAPVNTPVSVDELTFEALSLAFEISAASAGAFDPAAYPLTELWAFAPYNYTGTAVSVPSEESVAETLKVTGIENFVLNGNDKTVTKLTDGAKLDPGGIGKGFAADVIRRVLGERAKVIDFGATFYVTEPVTIAIQSPRSNELVASATVSYLSVATSGDYQRYYFVNGIRYHHIIGRNGYPSGYGEEDPVIAVTVTSPSAAVSDALSTAAMVLGNTQELETLLSGYGASAVLFTETGHYFIGDPPFVFD